MTLWPVDVTEDLFSSESREKVGDFEMIQQLWPGEVKVEDFRIEADVNLEQEEWKSQSECEKPTEPSKPERVLRGGEFSSTEDFTLYHQLYSCDQMMGQEGPSYRTEHIQNQHGDGEPETKYSQIPVHCMPVKWYLRIALAPTQCQSTPIEVS